MDDIRLETPTLTVTLADGSTHRVQVINPDYIRWDRTAAKHGWPSLRQAPFLWMTFLAWSALRRTGAIGQDVTWEAFSDDLCVQVASSEGPGGNGKAPADVDDLVASFLEEGGAPAEVGPMSGGPGPG